jgi:hypothetical protein
VVEILYCNIYGGRRESKGEREVEFMVFDDESEEVALVVAGNDYGGWGWAWKMRKKTIRCSWTRRDRSSLS